MRRPVYAGYRASMCEEAAPPIGPASVRPSGIVERREFLGLAAAGAALPLLRPRVRPGSVGAPSSSRLSLDDYVARQMTSGRMPGLAACVVADGRIAWARGYGWAHIGERRRVTPDTDFMLASISKTVTATAAMQAVEDGILALDADVNDVLPFDVRNPHHPGTVVTLRQLLTHTSSLRDNWKVFNRFYTPGDSQVPLGGFLRRYLTLAGDLYDPRRTYDRWRPGARYQYSNIGAALAGYLVEAASGIAFDAWCDVRIFGPLDMAATSWHLRGLDRTNVAMPYRATASGFEPYGQYGYPDYPDGELRTTARELAHHLLSFMGDGAFRGARVLQEDTVRAMRRSQVPDQVRGQGLIWYSIYRGGRRLIGHTGGDSGVATQMFFRPDDGVGVITLTNGDWHAHGGWPLVRVMDRLFEEAPALAAVA